MLEDLQSIHAEFPLFFYVSSFAFGAIVGSFLNVCIYRIPAKRSLSIPGSTCACGKRIAWYDNIPIFSWFILRGKARCCGSAYSFRYPAVELLTGLLFLASWHAHSPLKAICIMLFAAMLVCASFIDLDHMEIPNRFSVGLAVIGVAVSVAVPSLHISSSEPYAFQSVLSAFTSIIGVLIGSGVILWIALLAEMILRKDAMGFGDVKLLGGIGAFLGWQGALFSIFGGAVIGCIGLLIWKTLQATIPKLKSPVSKEDDGHIPFGPMLSTGALVYTLLLEEQIDSHFAPFLDLVSKVSAF